MTIGKWPGLNPINGEISTFLAKFSVFRKFLDFSCCASIENFCESVPVSSIKKSAQKFFCFNWKIFRAEHSLDRIKPWFTLRNFIEHPIFSRLVGLSQVTLLHIFILLLIIQLGGWVKEKLILTIVQKHYNSNKIQFLFMLAFKPSANLKSTSISLELVIVQFLWIIGGRRKREQDRYGPVSRLLLGISY